MTFSLRLLALSSAESLADAFELRLRRSHSAMPNRLLDSGERLCSPTTVSIIPLYGIMISYCRVSSGRDRRASLSIRNPGYFILSPCRLTMPTEVTITLAFLISAPYMGLFACRVMAFWLGQRESVRSPRTGLITHSWTPNSACFLVPLPLSC